MNRTLREQGVDLLSSAGPRSASKRECESNDGACPVAELREALSRERALLDEKDELLRRRAILNRESDHRLSNHLQLITGLISLQARASMDPAVTAELSTAANRVASIGRIHRHLHSADGAKGVAFKQYLEDLCRHFGAMMEKGSAHSSISVDAIDLNLPTAVGVPLGFVVNELITNALKHGAGGIVVTLKSGLAGSCALSVCNDGMPLPDGFSLADSKGLGMGIIRSFVAEIGGEVKFGRGDGNQGARFTVLFSLPRQVGLTAEFGGGRGQ